MSESRIGIIGGLSWESTASYYRYFNELFFGSNEWSQPQLLIDSVDFGAIVPLQREGNWKATGEILAASAKRLERAGATVLGIGANTMHVNFSDVQDAVAVPVVDVRDAVAKESLDKGHHTIALLGTKYLIEGAFYSDRLRELGVTSIKPTEEQAERLQFIIFSELTRGIMTKGSRAYLREVASSCRRTLLHRVRDADERRGVLPRDRLDQGARSRVARRLNDQSDSAIRLRSVLEQFDGVIVDLIDVGVQLCEIPCARLVEEMWLDSGEFDRAASSGDRTKGVATQ
jgi:aspartate racemase